MTLLGLFLIAATLLVVAGAAKVARPDDTARALAALGPRHRAIDAGALRHAVRVGALVEAALGAAALAFPRAPTAALVSGSYVGFAGVVALARRRHGPLATCGCFGGSDTAPTAVHLVCDLLLAAAAAAVACAAPAHATLVGVLAHQPWSGLPLLFVSAVGTWLTLLALSALGALQSARHLIIGPEPSVETLR